MRLQSVGPALRTVFALLLLLILAACSAFSVPPTPTLSPTSTPVPTSTAVVPPSPVPFSSPAPGPALARPNYRLSTLVDYDRHTVTVDEQIEYPNGTGQALTHVILAVVPNLWPDCFSLASLSIGDQPSTAFVLDGQRMDVTLPSPLGPDQIVRLRIQYTLNLPLAEQEDPNVSRPRIFGYTRAQLNLTNWYPFVVPFINGDWVLHEPWYYGEHLVYDASDFIVDLSFTDPASAPVVASSGFLEPGVDVARYTLVSGRAFAFSMSREFKVATRQFGDVQVSSYYFPFNDNGGQAVLDAAGQALSVFGQRYGPYPHRSLAIVMGDFNDGMEFSAFFYLSRDFYNLYNTAQDAVNYLIFVAVHETSHQWWFEQVANDQAEQPWLDEALATYSERIFYEAIYPDLVSGWWAYRVDFYQPQGFVDIPVYEGQGFRPYTNAVYFRGAHFLEDLRARLGDDIFFAFIKDYFSREQGRIATAADFFSILSEHTNADYSDIVRQYFQNSY